MGKTELQFQVSFLSTPAASCVSSETHKHERANVSFHLTCLKNRPLLPICPWGKISVTMMQKSNSLSLIQKPPKSCRASWECCWLDSCFVFPGIGQAGQLLCHLPHYNPELSKAVVWRVKFIATGTYH